MSKIKVTCDSTCDLTRELYDRYGIEVIPLGVCLGDDLRFDSVNITAQEIYDYAQKTGVLPKTSWKSLFLPILADGRRDRRIYGRIAFL